MLAVMNVREESRCSGVDTYVPLATLMCDVGSTVSTVSTNRPYMIAAK
jgi:hypothetical protein